VATATKFAVTGQAAGGIFNGAWTNPTNVGSDNGIYATAAPGKNQEFASVFPIAFTTDEVPAGATIDSALVEFQVKCSTTSSIGLAHSSLYADSAQTTAIGAVPGVSTPTTEPTADTTFSYSRTPSEAQIRDLWVRVQGTRGNSNTALTWSLDFVRVTVTYTEASPVTATPSTASLSTSTFAPTVSTSNHQRSVPGAASLSLTGFAPTVSVTNHRLVTPGVASLTLITFAPTVSAGGGVSVEPTTASLSTTTFAPTVSVSDHKSVMPGAVALALTGFAPSDEPRPRHAGSGGADPDHLRAGRHRDWTAAGARLHAERRLLPIVLVSKALPPSLLVRRTVAYKTR
jgi:hypothetical protein